MSYEEWEARYRSAQGKPEREPNAFLKECIHLLPPGRTLDIAMGDGRNAVFLAQRGFTVAGVDRSPTAVELATRRASEVGVVLNARVADLEASPLPPGPFDLIVVLHYLQRSLFGAIATALRPGGMLIYETWTRGSLRYGRHDPAHLLEPGELLEAFRDLHVLHYGEMELPAARKCVARLLARKSGGPSPAIPARGGPKPPQPGPVRRPKAATHGGFGGGRPPTWWCPARLDP